MVTDFPFILNSGVSSMGGEMISCLFKSLISTNSSNSNSIFVALKFRDSRGGYAPRSVGGVASFGPPFGVTGFAHDFKNHVKKHKTAKYNMYLIVFNVKM